MFDRMIEDLEKSSLAVYHIESNGVNFSKQFDVADLIEFNDCCCIGDLEFNNEVDITRYEELDTINYEFGYQDGVKLIISALL